MKKYLAFFKISLKKSLEYRGRLFIWFIWETIPPFVMLFFWTAAFKSKENIAGFSFYSMVIYYLVIIFARNLILTHPNYNLQKEIYRGKINNNLLKPLSLIILNFLYEAAYKVLRVLYLTPIFLICYYIFHKEISAGFHFNWLNLFFFLLSCSFSFCLNYLIKFLIGISSFWFTEIDWLEGLEGLVFWLFGGALLPLDFLPGAMQTIANFLPFKYIYYLPALGMMGKINLSQMCFSLIMQVFWFVLTFLFVKKIAKAGLKTYTAFGG